MPGNRVEALEEQVAELEATVQGLTEELVEANDRIRQIEAALGAEIDVALEDADVGVDPAQGAGTDDPHEAADEPAVADADEGVSTAPDDGVVATDEDPAARAARSETAEQPTGLRQEVEGGEPELDAVDDDGDALRLDGAAEAADAGGDPGRSVVEGTDAEHVDDGGGEDEPAPEADTDKGEGDDGSDDIIVA
jgi:uncharacterized coiled-coil protein SlyX